MSDQVTNPDSAVAGWSTHHCAASAAGARRPSSTRSSASPANASSHSARGQDLDRSTHQHRFRSCVNQPDDTDIRPGIRAETRSCEEVFREFLQARLGCGQTNPLWLRPCLRFTRAWTGSPTRLVFTVVAGAPCVKRAGVLLPALPACADASQAASPASLLRAFATSRRYPPAAGGAIMGPWVPLGQAQRDRRSGIGATGRSGG